MKLLLWCLLGLTACVTAGDRADRAANCTIYYVDADGDGVSGTDSVQSCDPSVGTVDPGGDCDDGDPTVYPGAAETCADLGVDNDCDPTTDVGDDVIWYHDVDGDGFGNAQDSEDTTGCDVQPDGYVANADDCNDGDAAINPDATEICSDDVDQDCSGTADACALNGSVDVGALIGAGGGWDIGGTSVAVFGDGRIAVGAPDDDVVEIVDAATGEVTDTISGDSGTAFGAAVAVGDFDGDGVQDVAVGAPGAASGAGEVTIYYGPGFASASATTITAYSGDSAFGFSLASASAAKGLCAASSYIDHDNLEYYLYCFAKPADASAASEVAPMGAFKTADTWPLTIAMTADGSEVAVGYSGGTSPGSQVYTLPYADGDSVDVQLTTTTTADLLGVSVALLDIDGSGISDLLEGAPGAGKMYALLDPAASSDGYGTSDADLKWTGDASSSFGAGIGLLGDLDGDADTEFAVGGDSTLWIFYRAEDGTFATTATTATATVTGLTGHVHTILNVGHANDDAYDDFVIADDANVTLLFGGPPPAKSPP